MVLVWGQYAWRRPWGYTADFCPVCRELRVFRQALVIPVAHVWYVPVWFRRPVARELWCRECGVVLSERCDGHAGSVAYDNGDLIDMMSKTRPHRVEAIEGRLALEERLLEGTVSNQEYLELLAEPFVALDAMVRARRGSASRSRTVDGLILSGVILTLLAAPFALISAFPTWVRVLLVALPVLMFGVACARALGGGRCASRAGLRFVARSLRKIDFEADTLGIAIAMAGSRGSELAKSLTEDEVIAEIVREQRRVRTAA